jgi:hypothetical protein
VQICCHLTDPKKSEITKRTQLSLLVIAKASVLGFWDFLAAAENANGASTESPIDSTERMVLDNLVRESTIAVEYAHPIQISWAGFSASTSGVPMRYIEFSRILRPLALFLFFASAISTVAHADVTIYSTSSSVSSGFSLENQYYDSQFGAASWTQTGSYTDVGINAMLGDIYSGDTGTAYLSTSIGASAIPITSQTFDFPSETDGTVSLFSGLSLGPGTYYLVVAGAPTETQCNLGPPYLGCGTYWDASTTPTIISDTGVTGNGFYGANHGSNTNPPASTWYALSPTDFGDLLFSAEGDPSTQSVIPEPGTLVLFGSGLVAIGIKLRRKLNRS